MFHDYQINLANAAKLLSGIYSNFSGKRKNAIWGHLTFHEGT